MTQGYKTRVIIGRDWHGQTRALRRLPPGAALTRDRESSIFARILRALFGG
jgi:hypothetical protein